MLNREESKRRLEEASVVIVVKLKIKKQRYGS